MASGKDPDEQRFDTGKELKRIRGAMSQQQFADLMGISRNTVMRYETNERAPDAEFLFKLNLVFGVDPSRVVLGRDSIQISDRREVTLLTNYRSATEDDKIAIDRMAELAAQSAKNKAPESP